MNLPDSFGLSVSLKAYTHQAHAGKCFLEADEGGKVIDGIPGLSAKALKRPTTFLKSFVRDCVGNAIVSANFSRVAFKSSIQVSICARKFFAGGGAPRGAFWGGMVTSTTGKPAVLFRRSVTSCAGPSRRRIASLSKCTHGSLAVVKRTQLLPARVGRRARLMANLLVEICQRENHTVGR